MNAKEVSEIIYNIDCLDYAFNLEERNGVLLLSANYQEEDIDTGKSELQKTRKWFISQHACKSEVVQTCLKCVLTSLEHRAREHFRYNGELVLGPHFDIDALHELAKEKRLERRAPILQ